MRIGQNQPCPCGSGQRYKRCCGPCHDGEAPTPEALMRSRYTAYVLGKVGYLMRTTDPRGPQHHADAREWQADLEGWCARTCLLGLEVLSSDEDGDLGHVWFRAKLQQGDHVGFMEEKSLFYRHGGSWLYHSGEPA